MKFKTNYFSLLLIVFLFAGGITMAQTPSSGATGVSTTTNFTFAGGTTLAHEYFRLSLYNSLNSPVINKDLGAATGVTGYTFNASDLTSGTQFANNTKYYWAVTNDVSGDIWEEGTSYTFTTVLGPPTATAATSLSTTSFSANWTANAQGGATSYILRVGTTSGGTDIKNDVNIGNVLTYSVTGLTANTTYYYSIKASDGTNITGPSNEITTLTLPAPPTATAATPIAFTSFSANWNAVSGASSYILTVGTTPGGTDIKNNFNVGNVTTYSVTGLTANTTYYYTIEVVVGANTSTPSNQITVLTLPAPPTATAASPITSTSFSANWNAVSGASSYILTVGTTPGGTDIKNNVNVGNVTTYSITGLTANTNYYYTVEVVVGANTSTSSNQITATTLLGAATANAASVITSSGFTANWTTYTGAASYILNVTQGATTTPYPGLIGTSYAVTGLTANTAYSYTVQAVVTGVGTSSVSNSEPVTTLIGPPTVAGATSLSTTSFTANWTANSFGGALTYTLIVTGGPTITGITGLSQAVTGLTANTAYSYTVEAVNGTATPASASNPVTTLLSVPTATAATSVTTTGFTANWNAIAGASSYTLLVTQGSITTPYPGLTGTSYAVTGLSAGTAYSYTVQVVVGTNTTIASTPPIPVTTLLGPPTVNPAGPITSTGFTASWTTYPGATGYILLVGTTPGGSDAFIQNVGNVLTYPVTTLAPNTTYYYSIEAIVGGVTGSPSTPQSFATLVAAPVATLATVVTATSFYANWNPPVNGGAATYFLKVGTSSGGTNVYNNNVGNVLTYQVSGLTSGITYYYSVEAVTAGGAYTTAFSNEITVTTAAPSLPEPTNGLTGVSVLPTFSWASVGGATDYVLYVSNNSGLVASGGTNWAYSLHVGNVQTYSTSAQLIAGALTNSDGFPLSQGTLYYWKVDPVVGTEQSATINHFTTSQSFAVNLSTPSNGSSVSSSPGSFSWWLNSSIYGLQFIVQYLTSAPTNEASWSTATALPATTLYSVTSPVYAGLTYYWRVLVQRTSYPNDFIYYPQATVYNTFTTPGGASVSVIPSWPVGGNTDYQNPPTLSWYLSESVTGLTYQVAYNSVSNSVGGTGELSDLSTIIFPNDPTPTTDGIVPLTYTPPSPLAAGTYWWQVRAIYYNGTSYSYSPWSTPVSFVTLGGGPGTPVVPIASYPGGGVTVYTTEPTLSWYLPTAASGLYYDIDLETTTTGLGNTVVYKTDTFGFDQLSYQLTTGLTAGTTYYWAVRSRNALGATSGWSNIDTFTVVSTGVGFAVASWPIGSTPPIEWTTQPYLGWWLNGDNTNVTGYIVKYKSISAPGDWTTYTPPVPNDTSGGIYTVGSNSTFSQQITTNLTPGETYYWAVYATGTGTSYNVQGQGSFTVVGAALSVVLSNPGNGSTVYNTSNTLSWYVDGSTVGLTGYTVYYSQSDTLIPLIGSVSISPGTQTATISGLVDGATYYWSVSATFTGIATPIQSPWWSFTVNTGSGSPSPTVQPFIGSPANQVQLSTGSPMLSWVLRAPPLASSTYEIELASNPSFSNAQTFASSKPFLQVSSLNVGNYYWKVRSKDLAGNTSHYSPTGQFSVKSVTAVDNKNSAIPKEFAVSQNYPNPFNPSTIINYALPKSSLVTLKIYNILGQEVKTLLNTQSPAGFYSVQWNGENNFGQHVASGIYIYRVTAGQYVKSMKMVMLK